MSTISNKKIFSLVAALLVAHSPSSAAGIRGLQSNRQQQDERGLSKGKGRPIHDPNATARYYNPNTDSVEVPQSALEARGRGKGKVAGANHNPHARSSNANTRTATINSVTVSQPATQPSTTPNPFSVDAFDKKCPSQESTLSSCVAQRGGDGTTESICKKCILGVASFSSATIYTLDSCSNPEVNGGACKECYEEAESYYNCGTGKSLQRKLGAEDNTITHSEPTGFFAPASLCPIDMPSSDASCNIEGYDYLECYYSHMICACSGSNPFFTCEEEANLRGGGQNIGAEIVDDNETQPSTGNFIPVSFCPIWAPEQNDSCDIGNHDFLECWYPDGTCTCSKENPFFTCEENM